MIEVRITGLAAEDQDADDLYDAGAAAEDCKSDDRSNAGLAAEN